jgi:2-haloacid dehalogenase
MSHRPAVIAFDVIETLFPLDPMREKLKESGLPGSALALWFARLLRDAMALELTGKYAGFQEISSAALKGIMAEHSIPSGEGQVEGVLAGMSALSPHDDVYPALELARSAGVRAMTLSNGSAQSTKKLLEKAGLSHLVERVISIDEVRHWKPARAVYLHAAQVARVEVHQMALVAAHSWDIQGAHQAGLVTGWLPRQEKQFSPVMQKPDVKGGTLMEVVRGLLELPLHN